MCWVLQKHVTDQIKDEHLLTGGNKLYGRDTNGSEHKDDLKRTDGCLNSVKSSLTAVPIADKYNNFNIEDVWI